MMKSIVIGRIGHVQATNSASLNEIFTYGVLESGAQFKFVEVDYTMSWPAKTTLKLS